MNTYYVAMTINGIEFPSSAVFSGTEAKCNACAKRMNRKDKHPTVKWIVVPCVS